MACVAPISSDDTRPFVPITLPLVWSNEDQLARPLERPTRYQGLLSDLREECQRLTADGSKFVVENELLRAHLDGPCNGSREGFDSHNEADIDLDRFERNLLNSVSLVRNGFDTGDPWVKALGKVSTVLENWTLSYDVDVEAARGTVPATTPRLLGNGGYGSEDSLKRNMSAASLVTAGSLVTTLRTSARVVEKPVEEALVPQRRSARKGTMQSTSSADTQATGVNRRNVLKEGALLSQQYTKKQELCGGSQALYDHITDRLKVKKSSLASAAQEYALAKGWLRTSDRLEAANSGSMSSPEALKGRLFCINRSCTQIRRVVSSGLFEAVCTCAILLNAGILGWSVHYSATELVVPDNLPSFFHVTDRVFTVVFLAELALRVAADGLVGFVCSPNWTWNVFDMCVVGGDLVETLYVSIASAAGGGAFQNLSAVRVLRILRMLRAIRVVRLVRFCKDLRMMVYSILRCGPMLMWSMCLLFASMFIFSVFLTQNVTMALTQNGIQSYEDQMLMQWFGGLDRAQYIMFQTIAGGISWGEVATPLFEIHWINGMVMIFYIFFTMFAILNIVTGIFVDTAIHSATQDRDEVVMEQLQQENSTLRQMEEFFKEADVDGSGEISLAELESHMTDNFVRAHFAAMGIELTEAKGIFNLLDLDRSGSVTIEEFIFGLMRIKGNARALDTATLLYENKRNMEVWRQFIDVAHDQWSEQQSFWQRSDVFFGMLLSSQGVTNEDMQMLMQDVGEATIKEINEGDDRWKSIKKIANEG